MKRFIFLLTIIGLTVALSTAIADKSSAEELKLAQMDKKSGEMKPMKKSMKLVREEPITDKGEMHTDSLKLWADTTLGKSGKSCSSCHPDGAMLSKAPYPRYIKMAGDTLTLDQMINFCMKNPLKAKPLQWNSKEMTILNHYVMMYSGTTIKKP